MALSAVFRGEGTAYLVKKIQRAPAFSGLAREDRTIAKEIPAEPFGNGQAGFAAYTLGDDLFRKRFADGPASANGVTGTLIVNPVHHQRFFELYDVAFLEQSA